MTDIYTDKKSWRMCACVAHYEGGTWSFPCSGAFERICAYNTRTSACPYRRFTAKHPGGACSCLDAQRQARWELGPAKGARWPISPNLSVAATLFLGGPFGRHGRYLDITRHNDRLPDLVEIGEYTFRLHLFDVSNPPFGGTQVVIYLHKFARAENICVNHAHAVLKLDTRDFEITYIIPPGSYITYKYF
jgi:hypothetical protein